jgi:N-acetylmuramoyl-L-alanine amidase
VSPTLANELGKLRIVFARDPVLPPSPQPLTFDNKSISQITFTEDNGTAELAILGNTPLLANFSNSSRTITVTAPPPPAPAPVAVQAPAPAPSSQPAPATSGRRILVVVDPAHGGDDRGASLSDQLAEKDVTLGFGRLLRHELEIRGVSVLLLRDGDSNPSLDQRATTANAAHAAAFVSLHAASQGSGVRVYWPLLPASEAKGVFHTWNAAQTSTLSLSHDLATAVAVALQKRQLSPRAFSASLRPLNNVVMPAIAVELAPGPNGVADLPSAKYQQIVAAAVAEAIASMRDQVGARQ